MSTLTVSDEHVPATPTKVIQPAWVRALHWTNAVAMVLMIMSGWQIYNASPSVRLLVPPSITLGGWLGGGAAVALRRDVAVDGQRPDLSGARNCHAAASAGSCCRSRPRGVIADTRAALTFKLSHDDLSKYNSVQKLLYAGIIVVGIVIVLSGLSMWKPVQLQWLTALFGGYNVARYVHFICMATIVAFLVVHVVLAVLVPKSLRAMIIGR